MTLDALRRRLGHIEERRGTGLGPTQAIIARLARDEDAEPVITARLAELGQRRERTPIIVLRQRRGAPA